QRAERFVEAEGRANEALELLQLAAQLASAAKRVRSLREVADISLQSEAIEVVTRRLHTTYRAAYALCDEPSENNGALPLVDMDGSGEEARGDRETEAQGSNRQNALEGLKLRVEQLAT